jgi:hypothetical protein
MLRAWWGDPKLPKTTNMTTPPLLTHQQKQAAKPTTPGQARVTDRSSGLWGALRNSRSRQCIGLVVRSCAAFLRGPWWSRPEKTSRAVSLLGMLIATTGASRAPLNILVRYCNYVECVLQEFC